MNRRKWFSSCDLCEPCDLEYFDKNKEAEIGYSMGIPGRPGVAARPLAKFLQRDRSPTRFLHQERWPTRLSLLQQDQRDGSNDTGPMRLFQCGCSNEAVPMKLFETAPKRLLCITVSMLKLLQGDHSTGRLRHMLWTRAPSFRSFLQVKRC